MGSDHDCNDGNETDNDIGINDSDDKSGTDDTSSSSTSLSDADVSSDDTSTSDNENNDSQCDNDNDENKEDGVVEHKINDDEYCELLHGEYKQLKIEIQSMKEKRKIILSQHEDLKSEQITLQQQKNNNDTFQELSIEFLQLHQQLLQIKEIKENSIKILNELQHKLESHGEDISPTIGS